MTAAEASGGTPAALARRLVLCCVLAAAALALAPGGASANVTCDYLSGPRWVTVGLYTAGDEATISRDGSSRQIYVEGKPCGSADTLNTDFILVADHSTGDTTVRIVSTAGGGFEQAPTWSSSRSTSAWAHTTRCTSICRTRSPGARNTSSTRGRKG